MAVLGWMAIFAMTLELLPQVIEYYMIAYIVSTAGFILGMFGAGTIINHNIRKRRQNRDDNDY